MISENLWNFHLNHVGYKAMDEVFDKIISNALSSEPCGI